MRFKKLKTALKQLVLLAGFTEQTDREWLFFFVLYTCTDWLASISFMLPFFLCYFIKRQAQNTACF
jgi:hypothetical protein